MTRPRSWRVMWLAGICVALAGVRTPAAQTGRTGLDLPTLLTTYSAGRFDEAVKAVANADEKAVEELRLWWPSAARLWIEVDAPDRSYRLLVAASFALEFEIQRAERGEWNADRCDGPCLLQWAHSLLIERGEPDDTERLWLLTTIALAEGVRDWGFLYTPVDPRQPVGEARGLLPGALMRFPENAYFRLVRAMALASRFSITTDGMSHTPSPPLPAIGPGIRSRLVTTREAARGAVIQEFGALGEDPILGAESRLRLGYVHWATGNDDAARVELEAAARLTASRDMRYLAHFLLGVTAETQGDAERAIAAYEAALAARPRSQSASLALAALELQRGNATRADELARQSVTEQPAGRDPWRQFLYADFPELPARLAAFRARVKR